MRKNQRNKLKREIENILFAYADSRDDDLRLTMYIWREFYPKLARRDAQNNLYFLARDIVDSLPREDHIKRIRAKIQNEEKRFLPTSWVVAKKRRIAQDSWEEWILKEKENKQKSFPHMH